jgi:hypothetical protein
MSSRLVNIAFLEGCKKRPGARYNARRSYIRVSDTLLNLVSMLINLVSMLINLVSMFINLVSMLINLVHAYKPSGHFDPRL